MSRELRNTDPKAFFLVTARTVNSELWLAPRPDINSTIAGVYARYQERHAIDIFALSVQSNHPHLLIRAPEENLAEFMADSQREIAKRTNYINGRTGPLRHRRYDAQLIVTYDDLIEAFLYVLTNPTKHGLVEHPRKWPGLNSYLQSLRGEPEYHLFNHLSEWDKGKPRVTEHPLVISPLPVHEVLSQKERRSEIIRLVNGRVERIPEDRKAAGLGFIGKEAVLQQVPGARPKATNRSPKPPCYSKIPSAFREFEKENKERKRICSDASYEFRSA